MRHYSVPSVSFTNSDVLASVMDIPEELRNRKVEIIILPYDNSDVPGEKTVKGALAKYKTEDLKDKENAAWMNAAGKKYENS